MAKHTIAVDCDDCERLQRARRSDRARLETALEDIRMLKGCIDELAERVCWLEAGQCDGDHG